VKPRTWLGAGAAVLVGIVACSAKSARPGELGNCTPTADAGCVPIVGGGGGSSGGDAGSGSDAPQDAVSADASACGPADALLPVTNTTCIPCVTLPAPNGCCDADLACALQACLDLIKCTKACALTDTLCISSCENTYPAGVDPYNQLATCMTQHCSPECPTLPTQTQGDH
jgi:hypothetical protein